MPETCRSSFGPIPDAQARTASGAGLKFLDAAHVKDLLAARTRFIPKSVFPHFEHVSWPRACPEDVRTGAVPNVRIDVGACLRGMRQ